MYQDARHNGIVQGQQRRLRFKHLHGDGIK